MAHGAPAVWGLERLASGPGKERLGAWPSPGLVKEIFEISDPRLQGFICSATRSVADCAPGAGDLPLGRLQQAGESSPSICASSSAVKILRVHGGRGLFLQAQRSRRKSAAAGKGRVLMGTCRRARGRPAAVATLADALPVRRLGSSPANGSVHKGSARYARRPVLGVPIPRQTA